jgi:hypothetical protein
MSSPQGKREGRQTKVGFGLAATGWEPQQITDVTVRMVTDSDTRHVEQDESQLERAPVDHSTLSGPGRLQGDSAVRKAERQTHVLISCDEVYPFADPLEGLLTSLEMTRSHQLEEGIKTGDLLALPGNPGCVAIS